MNTGRRTTKRGRDEIRRRLIDLLGEVANVAPAAIHDDATIENDLHMESVAFVELQVAIEEEYGIEVDPIQVVELDRFGDIVDYVHTLAQGVR